VGLIDDRVDPGALQRHGGHRAGDAAADDQCPSHLQLSSNYFVRTN
jgi:hypothetical protein